jgi:hypothetical protein
LLDQNTGLNDDADMQPLARPSGNTWIDYQRLAKVPIGENSFLIYKPTVGYQ